MSGSWSARCALIAVAGATTFAAAAHCAQPLTPCGITVVEKGTGWPVPMVELRTVHDVKFVSDNAGRIAFDLPELTGEDTWFAVTSDGYEVAADGFGRRGVRLTPRPGASLTVEVKRTSIAKRLGRLTGAGLFGESQKLGLEADWKESRILGCDSVLTAVHDGRMFWAWGDTSVARYPLGIFDTSSATTAIRPFTKFEPPLKLKFDYFTDERERPRGVAKMPGKGPTWLTGYIGLPDKTGKDRLVAVYTKIEPPLEGYESGLCVWNDKTLNFDHVKTIWTKSDSAPKHPPMPQGHPVIIDGEDGKKWALFGNPFPTLKCPATYEAWQDPAAWEQLTAQDALLASPGNAWIKPSSGSIAWNEYRKRWVTVFMQVFGKPTAFGEIWYAEAASAYGPWGPAVKVLSHANYSFYNPRLHSEFTPPNSPILLFEGTHSATFANHPEPTPRYEYNQILYRLDLDDPALAGAKTAANTKPSDKD